MKGTLAPGLATTRAFTVDDSRIIGFMGQEGRVYSTPSLLADIETTCRDMLLEHLDKGEDSVGTRVELDHTAATPHGFEVKISARVAKVDGRAVTLEVTAHDGIDEIGRCHHGRFVVDVARTLDRLAAKAAKRR